MSDVQRLFTLLVEALAAAGGGRLTRPFEISELYQEIAPYRAVKRALRFESVEDYEMAVLKLLAGEQGLVTVQPAEVSDALALEAEAINPDTGAFRQFAPATVCLNAEAVRSVLHQEASYAPPVSATPTLEEIVQPGPEPPSVTAEKIIEPVADPTTQDPVVTPPDTTPPAPAAPRAPVFEAIVAEPTPEANVAPACGHCDAPLPTHRVVHYCPACGRSVTTDRCPHCRNEVEHGWRFCVTCGRQVLP